MANRGTSLVTSEYYHIYNRGNSKNTIFHDNHDYEYFINLLIIMNTELRIKSIRTKGFKNLIGPKENLLNKNEPIVSIGAYCCMPNHFHILIKQEKDNGVSVFMQKLSTAYAMYYNKKYKHTGSLFEGRFKSKYAGDDTYLKYLFSYIHMNPLKIIDKNWKSGRSLSSEKALAFLYSYTYSSFNEYCNGIEEVTNKKVFPSYFPTKNHFKKEIFSWIQLESYPSEK